MHKWSSNCCTTLACLHCLYPQHNTQHNTTQHKIFGFLCCHGVDKGDTFHLRVGPVLTQHRRGRGVTFHRLCWPAVLTRLLPLVVDGHLTALLIQALSQKPLSQLPTPLLLRGTQITPAPPLALSLVILVILAPSSAMAPLCQLEDHKMCQILGQHDNATAYLGFWTTQNSKVFGCVNRSKGHKSLTCASVKTSLTGCPWLAGCPGLPLIGSL